jgi:hypothetical protein
MPIKEARARIKINKLLEAAGWRFFDDAQGKANITLEPNVTVKVNPVIAQQVSNDQWDQAMKYYFKAYATDHRLRDIIETGQLTSLNVYPAFGMSNFKAVPRGGANHHCADLQVHG